MLKVFKKINNPRQQRKYLDKQAGALKEIDVDQMNKILELSEYLDSIHFWNKYDSPFDETIRKAKGMKKEIDSNTRVEALSDKEKEVFQSTLSILTSYDKDIVVDAFDGNKKELQSILVKGKAYSDKEKYPSIQEAKALILDVMECKGSLEIHYFNGRRVLKKVKL